MEETTRAIVLHKTNYSESSIVVQLYSLHFGKISLLVQGAKKKKAKSKIALFEPLSILNISGNFSKTDKLIRPTEISVTFPFQNIPTKIGKRMLVMFLAEILQKSLKENIAEPDLFKFIERNLHYLELTENKIEFFHLTFLMRLTKYLGFFPFYSKGKYFSINEGNFTNSIPSSGLYLQEREKEAFETIIQSTIDNCHEIQLSNTDRKRVLNVVIEYYRVHIPEMGGIKSHEILETLFI